MLELVEGKTIGSLTLIKKASRGKFGEERWECVCKCGKNLTVQKQNLRKRPNISCGCSRIKDMLGKKYGRLVVLSFAFTNNVGDAFWNCKCDCGTEKIIRGASLRNNTSTSCGCLRKENAIKACTKHGQSRTADYRRWEVKYRRERKKELDSAWTPEMEILLRQLFDRCVNCGISLQEHLIRFNQSLHVDHVKPLSRKNGLKPGNATILCGTCNYAKSNKKLNELSVETANKISMSAELFKLVWQDYSIRYSYMGSDS